MRVQGCLTALCENSLNGSNQPFVKPLERGKWGDVVMCSKPYAWLNSQNSLEENCGPLSLNSFIGIPYSSKMTLRILMAA